jgi:hypothetical protein
MIMASADDLTRMNHHRPDGHLSGLRREARFGQGFCHPPPILCTK